VNIVLGLTGPNAAGKGEVANYLGQRGFRVHSLSDIVREEAEARGLPPEREHLIRIGNLLRERHGAGVLAERILERLGSWDVVDSIRSPSEVETLRRIPWFLLVGVDAPAEIRFARSLERARAGDPLSLEEFRAREEQENRDEAHRQRLSATLAMADHVLRNDGDLADLHREVDRLLGELERSESPPVE
jgi:dephospho-CoA kinase